MTQRECAIVMAYTCVAMLQGDALNEFFRYLEELYRRPVYTHEIGRLADEIKEKSKLDFIKLCKTAIPEHEIEKREDYLEAPYISRPAAERVFQRLEAEDIELFGVRIPECFPADRAIEALRSVQAFVMWEAPP